MGWAVETAATIAKPAFAGSSAYAMAYRVTEEMV